MNRLILIADDEDEIVEILDAYLRREGYRTACASDGQQALDMHASLKPDLMLLDVRMPHRDGWDVLGEMRRRGDTPVIMLTALDQSVDKMQGLRIGADDYIVKPFNPVEVMARVQAVLRRGTASAEDRRLLVVDIEIALDNYVASVQTPIGARRLDLTLTEFRLLAALAGAPSRVLSRDELAEACRLRDDTQKRTVNSHVNRLRLKLASTGSIARIVSVRGVGYRLEAPE
ncbi:response regulator transcription factor [Brevundimonas naejangsanensis]|uniref:response regulator transcription factor n=1 Tax=Brevundimonas naejangsanensis TaxID=588932 RepID=UPI000ED2A9CB|nr:response regulator transcription factor [Brevundimonas naejangsanensis]HAC00940.1 DNA-binding response regulator [Brevundimonas sp.]HCW49486.1 DNA-binding response regulator [Brevundimonas sp.]